jgi:glycosyltransferase involved in cell wall biosynthesis
MTLPTTPTSAPSTPARISVIIPVYNGERYLAEAINSVLAQTTAASQIIVVDDGSTDSTRSIADGFGSRIEYVWQPNGGAAAARNRGLELMKGDYVAFLDADDMWPPDKLAVQLPVLLESKAEFVFGRVVEFFSPELDNEIRSRLRCLETPTLAYLSGTMLASRDAVRRVGQFMVEWRVGEFIDWYLRAVDLDMKTLTIDNVVLRRRLHLTNGGLIQRGMAGDYVRIVKASLDRRRINAQRGTQHNADRSDNSQPVE